MLVAAMDASALGQSSTKLRLGRRPVVSKRKGDPDGGIERVNSPRMHFDIERTAQASARAFAPLQCACPALLSNHNKTNDVAIMLQILTVYINLHHR